MSCIAINDSLDDLSLKYLSVPKIKSLRKVEFNESKINKCKCALLLKQDTQRYVAETVINLHN